MEKYRMRLKLAEFNAEQHIVYNIIMRLVLDTDVLLAGVRSRRGASRVLLRGGLEKRFAWLMSPALYLEYEAVLMRSEHLSFLQWTEEQVSVLLAGIADAIVPVNLDFIWRPQLKDPADEMVLETAVNGGADYLATFNIRHFVPAADRFGINALRPGQLLAQHPEVFR